MKILKIIHGYPPNYNAGSEVYSQSICNELSNRHEVIVFTREENEYRPDFEFRNEIRDRKNFVYVNMPRGKDGYNHEMVNERIADLLEQSKPDIAHIGHLSHLSIGIIDELRKRGVPVLYTLHDFWLMCPRGQFLKRNFDGKNLFSLCDGQENTKCAESCYKMYQSGINSNYDREYWSSWIDKRMKVFKQVCKNINLFHAPSKYLMNRYINDFGIPKEKIIYLDYGFPLHYLTPVDICQSDEFVFGYIGTHIPAKGINMLIEAFKKVKGKARLKIFGRESGQNTLALKRMAEDSPNTIEFCGEYINKNLATTVFNNIHSIVVPSIWGENSPLVIHEAQACHIPVITANFGGMKEYVQHDENGLLFEHRNTDSLAIQLQYAIDNKQKMRTLGEKGYLFSTEGEVPSIQEHCMKLEVLYNKLIKENE